MLKVIFRVFVPAMFVCVFFEYPTSANTQFFFSSAAEGPTPAAGGFIPPQIPGVQGFSTSKRGLNGRWGRFHVHVDISKLSKFKLERVMDSLRSQEKV